MRLNFLLLFIILSQALMAQIFTKNAANPPFGSTVSSSIAFSDIDNDGDNDLLITGVSYDGIKSCLYLNDKGVFNEVPDTPFHDVGDSSIAFSDVDEDGDQDVLVTGYGGASGGVAKLYNNAGGVFSEVPDTPFEGVEYSDITFSDIDGDSDQDVLITGRNSEQTAIAKLYLNTDGTFSEALDVSFEGVFHGSSAFSDIDGDGDQDILITGRSNEEEAITKLYLNTNGVFNEVLDTPFEGVQYSDIVFSDVDGDGDHDLLITGQNNEQVAISKLYLNANGTFSEALGTSLQGIYLSSTAFSDIDGDGDQDLFLTGRNNGEVTVAKLYRNIGGNFDEIPETSFIGASRGSIAFSDIDLDGDKDLVVTGVKKDHNWPSEGGGRMAKLYINEGGVFTEVKHPPLRGVHFSAIAFSDIDLDGDNDLLITGKEDYSFIPTATLYLNEEGNFNEVTGTPFPGVMRGDTDFADIDGDGDEDVLISGLGEFEAITKLFINNSGTFIEFPGNPFTALENSATAFSDIDGDGDQDVLITGSLLGFGGRTTKLYINEGEIFSEIENTPFENVELGDVAFSDVDNDGDNDVLITGANRFFQEVAILYLNEGGNFTEVFGTPFEGVKHSAIAFSDIDGDGDEDVLICGRETHNDDNSITTKLYTNQGGVFTQVQDTPFIGAEHGSVAFSDIDDDGDKDVLISGGQGWPATTKLYLNEGGVFSELMDAPFTPVNFCSLAFSDINGDMTEDILLTGIEPGGGMIAEIYFNNTIVSTSPEMLSAKDVEFILHPNPANASNVNIRVLSQGVDFTHLKVFDLNGKLALQREQTFNSETVFLLNISSLSKGIYFIQLENARSKAVQKLIVQ